MKVCLVTRFFNLNAGGLGRFAVELKDGLEKRGIDVVCVSDPGGYNGPDYLRYISVKIPRMLPRNCDVYHALTPMESMYLPRNQSIVTFHDLIPWLHSDGLMTHYTGFGFRGKANCFISKHIFKFATMAGIQARYVVCDNKSVNQELFENTKVNPGKLHTITLGINPSFKPQPKPDNIFRVGTLSYLDPRKRIDLLINAFFDAEVDGELVIGGSGGDEARLKELAGGDARIKFLGFIPEDKMCEFYNSLDLFVFPTKIEGTGLPIIEAMACEKPVVVMDDSVIPIDIKSRCYTTNNLKTALTKNYGPWPHALAFARSYSWDSCVEQYINLYEEVKRLNSSHG